MGGERLVRTRRQPAALLPLPQAAPLDSRTEDRRPDRSLGGVNPTLGMRYPRMKPRPTTPGGYVISGAGPYRTSRWPLSRIPWGTPIRLDPTGEHLLYETGHVTNAWRRVHDLIPEASTAQLLDEFHRKFGHDRTYDRNGDGVPDVWVLNDFGPVAVNYSGIPIAIESATVARRSWVK